MASAKTTDTQALLDRCRYDGAATDWDEIIGHEAAKRELAVIAEQYRRSSVAERLGITLVKGVLLMSPPGVGKTMLARALAGSINRDMYVIPSAEANATMVREVYDHLRETPCVIVWDEADLILRNRLRSQALQGGRTVAAFCAALDGIDSLRGPVTMCLTAEAQFMLDESALRSGRLSTHIMLSLPTRDERLALWNLYTSRLPVRGELDLEKATDRSTDFSGADVQATVLAALGLAMVSGIDALDEAHLMEAVLRRGHVGARPEPSDEALQMRAVHEAGHSIYAVLTWGPAAVASVTLRPDDVTHGGRTSLADHLREEGTLDRTRATQLAGFALAGLVAEELVRGPDHASLGCSSDVAKATELFRGLVTELAGSDVIGPVAVDGLERGNASDRGAARMREEVYEAVASRSKASLEEVRARLSAHVPAIEALARHLMAATDQTLSGPLLTEAVKEVLAE